MEREQFETAADDDGSLIERSAAGDTIAFGRLVARYQRRAYGVALGVVGNSADARDACQDAFVRAYLNIRQLDEDAHFGRWLHRIVVNVCIDQLRRRRLVDEYDERTCDDEYAAAFPSPDRAFARGELRDRILAALGTLAPMHRTILVLREIDGLSYSAIAAHLDVPIGTVMSRLFNARRKMQILLHDDDHPIPTRAAADIRRADTLGAR